MCTDTFSLLPGELFPDSTRIIILFVITVDKKFLTFYLWEKVLKALDKKKLIKVNQERKNNV